MAPDGWDAAPRRPVGAARRPYLWFREPAFVRVDELE